MPAPLGASTAHCGLRTPCEDPARPSPPWPTASGPTASDSPAHGQRPRPHGLRLPGPRAQRPHLPMASGPRAQRPRPHGQRSPWLPPAPMAHGSRADSLPGYQAHVGQPPQPPADKPPRPPGADSPPVPKPMSDSHPGGPGGQRSVTPAAPADSDRSPRRCPAGGGPSRARRGGGRDQMPSAVGPWPAPVAGWMSGWISGWSSSACSPVTRNTTRLATATAWSAKRS